MNNVNKHLFVLWLVFLLSSCSSSSTLDCTDPGGCGGGIGGTGVTSYSVGTLTGFGSVFINGNRFDTTTADFLVNGQSAGQSQLRVGMQLTALVDFNNAVADQVNYSATLIGPVSSAADATGRLRILNQTVTVGAGTILDSLTLAELVPGRAIEVSGVTNANGELIASYIRPALSSEIQITGSISSVDDNQQRITVRNVSIAIEQADITAFNGSPLTPGMSVIVTAPDNQFNVTTNTLVASTLIPGTAITPAEDARIELTGFVQTFTDISSFTVDGIRITTSDSTQYEAVDGQPLNPDAVSINSLIEVEGIFLSTDIVEAQRIVILPVENTELVGRIEALDANARTVTLLGVPVQTTALTRFSGDRDGTINFDALRIGDYVEIDASFMPSGLLATKIEIDELDDEVSIEGPVTQVDANQRRVEIAGISVVFNAETEYELDENDIEIDEQTFFNAVSIGTIVKAKWKVFSSVEVPVDELEIE